MDGWLLNTLWCIGCGYWFTWFVISPKLNVSSLNMVVSLWCRRIGIIVHAVWQFAPYLSFIFPNFINLSVDVLVIESHSQHKIFMHVSIQDSFNVSFIASTPTKPNKTNQQSSNITPVSTLMPPPKTPVRDEPNISSVLTTPPPVGKVRQL